MSQIWHRRTVSIKGSLKKRSQLAMNRSCCIPTRQEGVEQSEPYQPQGYNGGKPSKFRRSNDGMRKSNPDEAEQVVVSEQVEEENFVHERAKYCCKIKTKNV